MVASGVRREGGCPPMGRAPSWEHTRYPGKGGVPRLAVNSRRLVTRRVGGRAPHSSLPYSEARTRVPESVREGATRCRQGAGRPKGRTSALCRSNYCREVGREGPDAANWRCLFRVTRRRWASSSRLLSGRSCHGKHGCHRAAGARAADPRGQDRGRFRRPAAGARWRPAGCLPGPARYCEAIVFGSRGPRRLTVVFFCSVQHSPSRCDLRTACLTSRARAALACSRQRREVSSAACLEGVFGAHDASAPQGESERPWA